MRKTAAQFNFKSIRKANKKNNNNNIFDKQQHKKTNLAADVSFSSPSQFLTVPNIASVFHISLEIIVFMTVYLAFYE